MTSIIHSARAVDRDGIVDDAWILFAGTTIVERGRGDDWRTRAGTTTIDAQGLWLTPGFIDLHAHGGGGHAFDDGAEAIAAALAVHRAHGTTRSVITLVADPIPQLQRNLATIADIAKNDPLVLGSHLEGPFLAREHRGAQNGNHICDPDRGIADNLIEAARGTLRQITVAPERPGAYDIIDHFVAAGVVVAIGHTNADYKTTHHAFDRGATLLTHTFNGMNGIHHRRPGPIVAAFEDERITLEIILDGLHVHTNVAKIAFLSAPNRIALVTDGMAAAGSVDGHYRFGSRNVTVTNGMAVLSGTRTIAGSTLTQDRALRTAIVETGETPESAVAMLTSTPAHALGIDDQLGYLRPGYAADLVLLDTEWNITHVWGAGTPIV